MRCPRDLSMLPAIRNADECTQALERALEAMDPPLDVHAGILRLIANLVPYGECRLAIGNEEKRGEIGSREKPVNSHTPFSR